MTDKPPALESDIEKLHATINGLAESMSLAQLERDNYKKLYELAIFELERIKRNLFGKKAEEVPLEQLRLAFEKLVPPGLVDDLSSDSDDSHKPKDRTPDVNRIKSKPTGRRPLPDDLPVERIVAPSPQAPEGCELVQVGEEVSETVEWRRGSFVKVQYVRPKFAIKGRPDDGIIVPPPLDRPIAKGLAGPGLLAHVITSKYADHLPLHRLEQIFERSGLSFSKSTMCQWIEGCHELVAGIVSAMWQELLNGPYIAVDATGVLVRNKEQCRRGHFWVALAKGEHVLYRFSNKHDKKTVKELLGGFKGYIQADAATVFDFLFKDESRTEVACWAHCRRRFFDAMATDPDNAVNAISLIAALYRIDRKTAELKGALRTKERANQCAPIVETFFTHMDRLHLDVLPQSPIGKAVAYARNQREALCNFMKDGSLRLDNNAAELALRHQAIGRKNWLFVATEDGAKWNTVFVSLIASCKMHDIEPWGYLRDILCLLPSWPRNNLLVLAPKYWKQTAQQAEVAQLLADNPFRKICP